MTGQPPQMPILGKPELTDAERAVLDAVIAGAVTADEIYLALTASLTPEEIKAILRHLVRYGLLIPPRFGCYEVAPQMPYPDDADQAVEDAPPHGDVSVIEASIAGLHRAGVTLLSWGADLLAKPYGQRWWLADQRASNQWWEQATSREKNIATTAVATTATAGLAAAAGVAWGVSKLLTASGHATVWAVKQTGNALHIATINQIISRPAHSYLAVHTTGLPVPAAAVQGAWTLVMGLLLAWSVIGRSAGARIGWTLMGAASIAAIWAGSPAVNAPVAAGFALAVWSVLSIAAFRGLGHRACVVIEDRRSTTPRPTEPKETSL
jgi:hypothetical protein